MNYFVCCLLLLLQGATADVEDAQEYWPQFRGPASTGVAPLADPPTEWSETENVKWKTAIPGLGHSSPVVWADHIFLTTASPVGAPFPPRPDTAPGAHDNLRVSRKFEFIGLAVDRTDGRILWQKKLHEAIPHEGGHYTGSLASASPVTDGEHVYFFFGSYGLYCLDFEGHVVWQQELGRMQSKHGHGEGSSPALHGDIIVVNWDHEGGSFVVAMNKMTGKEIWRAPRPEATSWATPIVIEHAGKPQLIISGTNRVRGYDLQTGQIIWECGGLSANVVASPVASDGMVFAASSYDTRAILAIKLDGAHGDITGTDQVAWTHHERTPYVPSPLLYDGSLYYLRHYQGILTRLVSKTGAEPTGPFRLSGIRDVYASPVAAAGRIYFVDRSGITVIVSHEEIPRAIAMNQLQDKFSATPALVGKELLLRGEEFLYCLRKSGD